MPAIQQIQEKNYALAPSMARTGAAIIGGSLLIALLAQVSMRLPFTPVPVTLQTLGIYLVAAALGPRKGALAVMAYLTEGFAGLPVFTPGNYGFAALLSPTGGYLLGFLPAVMISGYMLEKLPKSRLMAAAAFLCGAAALYACGVLRLAGLLPSNILFAAGVLPFAVGEIFKITLAATLAKTAGKITRRLA
ncbi:MAG: biotin transporter BioY [Elusimicrobia bacterium]|nr:biotin transporter BioY [Elusimicrobiota bacterium]